MNLQCVKELVVDIYDDGYPTDVTMVIDAGSLWRHDKDFGSPLTGILDVLHLVSENFDEWVELSPQIIGAHFKEVEENK